MYQRIIGMLLCLAVLLPVISIPANAATSVPYLGYEYNTEDESVPAPVGYEPTATYLGSNLGVNGLSSPSDFCFYNNELYILDAGNSRIVVTDAELHLLRVIGEIQLNGESLSFAGAGGLFVCDNGDILIADTAGQRIIECRNDGSGVRILGKPETPMLPEKLVYSVKKVTRDKNGITYALVDGVNEGAVTYMQDGTFGGFFAMNEVEKTAAVILNYLWQRFMTEEQIRNSATASPSSITNFDIADKGFVYTVTQSSEGESSVRRLNYKGSNLETDAAYGDLEWDRKIKNSVSTAFCDVDVDGEKYIYLLDSSRGRVFVYSEDGHLISVFGGIGEKVGTFASPCAVETNGDRVYVLDNLQGSITVFTANDYIKTLRKAQNLLDAGKYGESRTYWEQVLRINSNSTLAYYGIGLALDEAGQYREALHYFKLSYENEAYSEAFKEVRREYIKANFIWLMLITMAVIAGLVLLVRLLKKKFRRKNAYERSALEGKYTAPFFTMLHPMDGFEMLKRKRLWSLPLTAGILTLLFLSLTVSWFFTGFSFNQNRASDYNVLITLLQAFVVIGVCTVANWAVCTLIEGKGRLIDIFCMMCYSMLPYIGSVLLCVLLSNVMTLEENAFLTAIRLAGIIWSGLLIFVGSMSIHQFGFSKNILSVILTVFGIAVIIFLAILFVGLMQQVFSFIRSVWSEAAMMQ